ncbi:MAG: peptidyl-tRNA hydrolase Pth2 [Anaerolineae bacterium]|nr:peptidyl-tRNA hydrolase Pth2 [Anaerolineae bacterium]
MKQIIVVDASLKLPKGKLAAQVAHAAVAAFLVAGEASQQIWLGEGMPKVVLRVDNEADLHRLHDLAQQQQLPTRLIHDAGRTVVAGGTVTCLGIGPAPDDTIDALTGDLKLLR